MLTDFYPTLLIPAYQPNKKLIQLVKTLRKLRPTQRIIVVDDGSDIKKSPIFSKLSEFNIELLRHPENQGKGQALKTGFKHWLETSASTASGIVTADADGQHLPRDILHISDVFMQNPSSLYLGVRQFTDASTPWRSRVGNKITKFVLRLFTNIPLQDTQTGLRAIPRKLMKALLHSKTSGYDFELEMLLAAKENQIPIQQTPISTVYLDGNSTSHFNPLLDSIKIYFVFIRFAAISLLSAAIDFIVFSFFYWIKKNIFLAVLLGRILSATFNFKLNHHLAFKSQNKLLPAAIKYASLASFLGLIAYSLITFIHSFGINVYSSKIIAEIALFILSFTIQRLFIFNKIN
ncbi:bifunctional glycosyltransferase family 2/GtrA family protein [Rickettsiella endosymbiont of Dermanyssus gallinae]|uniref:bifunctional glycosyltransferase family 2/GtrA family protein n=1 Tax=Rickettsiella endosymbiont of Dermanyssus gallinae TaxID=2856608 RepID=UPI001C531F84|nr:bifunctional glycosyltransferase family 2/GtrA family protein [Rickettsiella endosymbiont of Dermanyssus gallinae]